MQSGRIFETFTQSGASGRATGLRVKVYSRTFRHAERARYFAEAARTIAGMNGRKVVLLDPDTGLAPGYPSPKHVERADLLSLWDAMEPGDWLVVYQHAWRDRRWRQTAKQRFRGWVAAADMRIYRGEQEGRDVIIMAARRDRSPGRPVRSD